MIAPGSLQILYRALTDIAAPILHREEMTMRSIKPSVFAFCVITQLLLCPLSYAQPNVLMTKALSDLPGKEIQVVRVDYAPGALDGLHRHNAHAVVYVLEGELEMQVSGGALQRLRPGQVFYESPTDVHTICRNASKTKPAKFIAFFVKNEGAPILVPGR